MIFLQKIKIISLHILILMTIGSCQKESESVLRHLPIKITDGQNTTEYMYDSQQRLVYFHCTKHEESSIIKREGWLTYNFTTGDPDMLISTCEKTDPKSQDKQLTIDTCTFRYTDDLYELVVERRGHEVSSNDTYNYAGKQGLFYYKPLGMYIAACNNDHKEHLLLSIFSFDSVRNVVSATKLDIYSNNTWYEYDSQNGIFKSIVAPKWLLIWLEHSMGIFGSFSFYNNLAITRIYMSSVYKKYSYIYDDDGYPTEVTPQKIRQERDDNGKVISETVIDEEKKITIGYE